MIGQSVSAGSVVGVRLSWGRERVTHDLWTAGRPWGGAGEPEPGRRSALALPPKAWACTRGRRGSRRLSRASRWRITCRGTCRSGSPARPSRATLHAALAVQVTTPPRGRRRGSLRAAWRPLATASSHWALAIAPERGGAGRTSSLSEVGVHVSRPVEVGGETSHDGLDIGGDQRVPWSALAWAGRRRPSLRTSDTASRPCMSPRAGWRATPRHRAVAGDRASRGGDGDPSPQTSQAPVRHAAPPVRLGQCQPDGPGVRRRCRPIRSRSRRCGG